MSTESIDRCWIVILPAEMNQYDIYVTDECEQYDLDYQKRGRAKNQTEETTDGEDVSRRNERLLEMKFDSGVSRSF